MDDPANPPLERLPDLVTAANTTAEDLFAGDQAVTMQSLLASLWFLSFKADPQKALSKGLQRPPRIQHLPGRTPYYRQA